MTSRLKAPPKSLLDQRQTWALRLIPVTAAVGPKFFQTEVLGVGLFTFRLLVAALVVLTIGSATHWRKRRLAQAFLLLCLGWTIWGGFSLLWAPDLGLGLQQTLAVGFGLAVAVVMFNLGLHRDSHFDALIEGWMMAYVLAGGFAVRELLTGVYLSGDITDLYRSRAIDGIAISLFDNPNNYAAFIVLCVPFLLLGYTRARTKLRRRMALLLVASTPVFMFFSTSRLGLLGILVMFLVYAAIGLDTPRKRLKYLALGATVVFLIGGVWWSGSRTANDIALTLRTDVAVTGSDTLRWNLALNGLWMVQQTGGVGVGAGGYGVVTATEDVPKEVGFLVDPHNFWIEVVSQYGIIIFFGLVVWLGRMAFVAARVRRLSAYGANPFMYDASVAVLLGLSGYLFAAVANSSYITQSTNWVFLASLAALSSNLEFAASAFAPRMPRGRRGTPGRSPWMTPEGRRGRAAPPWTGGGASNTNPDPDN